MNVKQFKEFVVRVFYLPAQALGILFFLFWLCLVVLCGRDPEEEEP